MKITSTVTIETPDGTFPPGVPVEIADDAEARALVERFGGAVLESDGAKAPKKPR